MQDKPFQILIVEDITRYHELIAREIKDALYADLQFVTTGEEALQILATDKIFDLVLLDLNLPKLGGEEVLKRIRAEIKFDSMPVIILTGDGHQSTQGRLLALGANDFVEKGCAPEVFIARIKAQVRQKLTLDRLARLVMDLDIFAAGVLHDIRGYETKILALCDIITMQLKSDAEKNLPTVFNDLDALRTQARHIGEYAGNVIQKVRETHHAPLLEPQNIEECCEWVMGHLGTHDGERAEAKAPALTWRAVEPLQAVLADKHFLRLVLLNIFQNASKFCRPGQTPEIRITQELVTSPIGRAQILTRFTDNGIGLGKGQSRKIFEPFFRGVSRPGIAGSGLGLSLVAKVVGMMGGRVWAEESTSGAIFAVELQAP